MKLPNRKHAHVPKRKLTAYLLSPSHPVGKSKARFFRENGFDSSDADRLREALREMAQQSEVDEVEQTPYGTKYVIVGSLHSPDEEPVSLRAV